MIRGKNTVDHSPLVRESVANSGGISMDDHNSTSAQGTTSPAAPRRSRRGLLVAGIGLLLGAAALWWSGKRDAPPLEDVVVETKTLESTAGSATRPAADSKTTSEGTSAQRLI